MALVSRLGDHQMNDTTLDPRSAALLTSYLLAHEDDIYLGENDFDTLRHLFRHVFGRAPDLSTRSAYDNQEAASARQEHTI